ncbi:uncharacterized protein EI90DRAFT_3035100 [Cantharellus anzutake]|uniref:uncharacterized protein n=1 Tax=Cantharellus anzutake TaxID=1750568 RepID=UPI001904A962|nr:uncharacterized protein EI90DRAFT_3035100 [Cantharellus anzutake]KAF8340294.1 hypothetical protein EI90DRAFT_3035100 [Cantharellus anzutake]
MPSLVVRPAVDSLRIDDKPDYFVIRFLADCAPSTRGQVVFPKYIYIHIYEMRTYTEGRLLELRLLQGSYGETWELISTRYSHVANLRTSGIVGVQVMEQLVEEMTDAAYRGNFSLGISEAAATPFRKGKWEDGPRREVGGSRAIRLSLER